MMQHYTNMCPQHSLSRTSKEGMSLLIDYYVDVGPGGLRQQTIVCYVNVSSAPLAHSLRAK
eukprot:1463279-Pyramimonas_sp.AAC.2